MFWASEMRVNSGSQAADTVAESKARDVGVDALVLEFPRFPGKWLHNHGC